MYAIVATGGKQVKVEKGKTVDIELVGEPGETVSFRPVLMVDGENLIHKPSDLAKANVEGKVLEQVRGPRIEGFTYKSKTNNRRRFGHRQQLSRVEITKVNKTGGKAE